MVDGPEAWYAEVYRSRYPALPFMIDFLGDNSIVFLDDTNILKCSKIRKEIEQKLAKGTSFPNVIHPTAQINETVRFGKGNIFLQNVIISCDVSIGDFCVFDRVVNIGHDSKIGSHVHFSPLAVLSGNTSIGNLVEIGSHAAIKQKISIIDNSIVGMGAVVVKNIDNVGVYVGNPAKKIK